MLSISLSVFPINSIASTGHTGRHIPHPLQVALFITAISLPSNSSFKIASKGQVSLHLLHQQQRSLSILAIVAAWLCGVSATALIDVFVAQVGASDTADLLAGLVRDRYQLSADVAPIVFAIAEQGDVVAQEIIAWAGQSLGDLANAVICQLDLTTEIFDVVLSGSLYKGGTMLIDPMRQTIQAVAPGANLVRLTAPPVVGGVLLGLEAAGLDPAAARSTLLASANDLMKQQVDLV